MRRITTTQFTAIALLCTGLAWGNAPASGNVCTPDDLQTPVPTPQWELVNTNSVRVRHGLQTGFVDVLITRDPLVVPEQACGNVSDPVIACESAPITEGDLVATIATSLPDGTVAYYFARARRCGTGEEGSSAWVPYQDASGLSPMWKAYQTQISGDMYGEEKVPMRGWSYGRYGEVIRFLVERGDSYTIDALPQQESDDASPEPLYAASLAYQGESVAPSWSNPGNVIRYSVRRLDDRLGLVTALLPAQLSLNDGDTSRLIARVYHSQQPQSEIGPRTPGYRELLITRTKDSFREAMIASLIRTESHTGLSTLFSDSPTEYLTDVNRVQSEFYKWHLVEFGWGPDRYADLLQTIAAQWNSGASLGSLSVAERRLPLGGILTSQARQPLRFLEWSAPGTLMINENKWVGIHLKGINQDVPPRLNPGVWVALGSASLDATLQANERLVQLEDFLGPLPQSQTFDMNNPQHRSKVLKLGSSTEGSRVKRFGKHKAALSVALYPRFFNTHEVLPFPVMNTTRRITVVSPIEEDDFGMELVADKTYRASFVLRPGVSKLYPLKKKMGFFRFNWLTSLVTTNRDYFVAHLRALATPSTGEPWIPSPLPEMDGDTSCANWLQAEIVEYGTDEHALRLNALSSMPDEKICLVQINQYESDGKFVAAIERAAVVSTIGLPAETARLSIDHQTVEGAQEATDALGVSQFVPALHPALRERGKVKVELTRPVSIILQSNGSELIGRDRLNSPQGLVLEEFFESFSSKWNQFKFYSPYAGKTEIRFTYRTSIGEDNKRVEPEIVELVDLRSYELQLQADVDQDGNYTSVDKAVKAQAPGLIVVPGTPQKFPLKLNPVPGDGGPALRLHILSMTENLDYSLKVGGSPVSFNGDGEAAVPVTVANPEVEYTAISDRGQITFVAELVSSEGVIAADTLAISHGKCNTLSGSNLTLPDLITGDIQPINERPAPDGSCVYVKNQSPSVLLHSQGGGSLLHRGFKLPQNFTNPEGNAQHVLWTSGLNYTPDSMDSLALNYPKKEIKQGTIVLAPNPDLGDLKFATFDGDLPFEVKSLNLHYTVSNQSALGHLKGTIKKHHNAGQEIVLHEKYTVKYADVPLEWSFRQRQITIGENAKMRLWHQKGRLFIGGGWRQIGLENTLGEEANLTVEGGHLGKAEYNQVSTDLDGLPDLELNFKLLGAGFVANFATGAIGNYGRLKVGIPIPMGEPKYVVMSQRVPGAIERLDPPRDPTDTKCYLSLQVELDSDLQSGSVAATMEDGCLIKNHLIVNNLHGSVAYTDFESLLGANIAIKGDVFLHNLNSSISGVRLQGVDVRGKVNEPETWEFNVGSARAEFKTVAGQVDAKLDSLKIKLNPEDYIFKGRVGVAWQTDRMKVVVPQGNGKSFDVRWEYVKKAGEETIDIKLIGVIKPAGKPRIEVQGAFRSQADHWYLTLNTPQPISLGNAKLGFDITARLLYGQFKVRGTPYHAMGVGFRIQGFTVLLGQSGWMWTGGDVGGCYQCEVKNSAGLNRPLYANDATNFSFAPNLFQIDAGLNFATIVPVLGFDGGGTFVHRATDKTCREVTPDYVLTLRGELANPGVNLTMRDKFLNRGDIFRIQLEALGMRWDDDGWCFKGNARFQMSDKGLKKIVGRGESTAGFNLMNLDIGATISAHSRPFPGKTGPEERRDIQLKLGVTTETSRLHARRRSEAVAIKEDENYLFKLSNGQQIKLDIKEGTGVEFKQKENETEVKAGLKGKAEGLYRFHGKIGNRSSDANNPTTVPSKCSDASVLALSPGNYWSAEAKLVVDLNNELLYTNPVAENQLAKFELEMRNSVDAHIIANWLEKKPGSCDVISGGLQFSGQLWASIGKNQCRVGNQSYNDCVGMDGTATLILPISWLNLSFPIEGRMDFN